MRLVPDYFKPFLIAQTPRSEHKLDASGYLVDICVPSFIGKIITIIKQFVLCILLLKIINLNIIK